MLYFCDLRLNLHDTVYSISVNQPWENIRFEKVNYLDNI